MILTGKAKKDFLKFFRKRKIKVDIETEKSKFDLLDETEFLEFPYILEWLDSIGIFIIPRPFTDMWAFDIRSSYDCKINKLHYDYPNDISLLDNRTQATKIAIEKVNDHYNYSHEIQEKTSKSL